MPCNIQDGMNALAPLDSRGQGAAVGLSLPPPLFRGWGERERERARTCVREEGSLTAVTQAATIRKAFRAPTFVTSIMRPPLLYLLPIYAVSIHFALSSRAIAAFNSSFVAALSC